MTIAQFASKDQEFDFEINENLPMTRISRLLRWAHNRKTIREVAKLLNPITIGAKAIDTYPDNLEVEFSIEFRW